MRAEPIVAMSDSGADLPNAEQNGPEQDEGADHEQTARDGHGLRLRIGRVASRRRPRRRRLLLQRPVAPLGTSETLNRPFNQRTR